MPNISLKKQYDHKKKLTKFKKKSCRVLLHLTIENKFDQYVYNMAPIHDGQKLQTSAEIDRRTEHT